MFLCGYSRAYWDLEPIHKDSFISKRKCKCNFASLWIGKGRERQTNIWEIRLLSFVFNYQITGVSSQIYESELLVSSWAALGQHVICGWMNKFCGTILKAGKLMTLKCKCCHVWCINFVEEFAFVILSGRTEQGSSGFMENIVICSRLNKIWYTEAIWFEI